MHDRRPQDRPHDTDSFAQSVGRVAERKLRAQSSPARTVWLGLGTMGLIGWSVVVPTLLGAALGMWLDRYHAGRHGWTLALMVGGLSLGCLNAWRWVAQEDRAMHAGNSSDSP